MFTRKEKGLLEENKRENKILTSTSNRIGSRRTSTLGVHPLLGDLASRTRKRNQGSSLLLFCKIARLFLSTTKKSRGRY
jgi:hypothetical protein